MSATAWRLATDSGVSGKTEQNRTEYNQIDMWCLLWQVREKNAQLKEILGLETVSMVISKGRLNVLDMLNVIN